MPRFQLNKPISFMYRGEELFGTITNITHYKQFKGEGYFYRIEVPGHEFVFDVYDPNEPSEYAE